MNLFSRLYVLMTKPAVILFFAIILILNFIWVDRPLAEYLASFHLGYRAPWLYWLTSLGLGFVYTGLFFLSWLFFRYIYFNQCWQERCLFLLISILLIQSVCLVLKMLLGRARPELWLQAHEYGFYWLKTIAAYWSFPSGHTTTIMTVAFSLCVIFPARSYFFLFIASLVAVSRILLVQHYLTDVLASSYLSLLMVGFLVYFLQRGFYFERIWKYRATEKLEESQVLG